MMGSIRRGALAAVLMLAVMAGSASADGGTPVTCGSVIAAPGNYYLASDCTGPGITIQASHVQLMLDGHTMTGDFSSNGVEADNVTDVHIEGPGTVTGYGDGIAFSGVTKSHADHVLATVDRFGFTTLQSTEVRFNNDVATQNTFRGFWLRVSTDIRIDNSTATQSRVGISVLASTSNHIDGNTADNNTLVGIVLGPGSTDNHLDGNTALGNGLFDLNDLNPNCDSNVWEGNTFVTTDQPQCVS